MDQRRVSEDDGSCQGFRGEDRKVRCMHPGANWGLSTREAPHSAACRRLLLRSVRVPFTLKVPVSTVRRRRAGRRHRDGVLARATMGTQPQSLCSYRGFQFKAHFLRCSRLKMHALEGAQGPQRRARHAGEVEIELGTSSPASCQCWSPLPRQPAAARSNHTSGNS